ncbi:MAG: 1-(5-phosphoribosyl)-5-[(5-phosphoribosylamino)methylideneamino]imidazole-4-carboxamide isomerase [Bacteroidales bacterium]|nr:1-(5-phosphoribosyl)-5-[(5-phosphoribosylamino)methylideneamino]imidazole-4-carboxamide isomerase [Bacteroidales bacterium]
MIDVIPAIDIIGGKCVRLKQGNYKSRTIYHENPVEVARAFDDAGIKRLHLVDLDGAKAAQVVNLKVLAAIASATELEIDFGGGIKSDTDIQKVFDHGARMVTVGSIAVTNPAMLGSWIARYGSERIILGADVKGDKIAISGWTEETDTGLFEYLADRKNTGIKKVLCTDISKDGMLKGPAVELYQRIKLGFADLYLIASGGVSAVADIEKLEESGIDAVVIGKALYEKRISINDLKKFL